MRLLSQLPTNAPALLQRGQAHLVFAMQPQRDGWASWQLALADEHGQVARCNLDLSHLCGDVLGDWLAAMAVLQHGCAAVEMQWAERHHTHQWRLVRSRNQGDPPASEVWLQVTLTTCLGHPDDEPDPDPTQPPATTWTGRCMPSELARAAVNATRNTLKACGGEAGYQDAWSAVSPAGALERWLRHVASF